MMEVVIMVANMEKSRGTEKRPTVRTVMSLTSLLSTSHWMATTKTTEAMTAGQEKSLRDLSKMRRRKMKA